MISDNSISEDQRIAYSATRISQMCEERVLSIRIQSDYDFKFGNFVRDTITCSPYNGQHNMRFLNKGISEHTDLMDLMFYDKFPGEF